MIPPYGLDSVLNTKHGKLQIFYANIIFAKIKFMQEKSVNRLMNWDFFHFTRISPIKGAKIHFKRQETATIQS